MRIMRSFWGFGDLIGMRRDNIGFRDITPHKGLAQMGGERGWGHLGFGGLTIGALRAVAGGSSTGCQTLALQAKMTIAVPFHNGADPRQGRRYISPRLFPCPCISSLSHSTFYERMKMHDIHGAIVCRHATHHATFRGRRCNHGARTLNAKSMLKPRSGASKPG